MTDKLTPEQRSWNMAQIKSKDTRPELMVRSMLHRAGYRFTVNGPRNKTLPGKPDIVLPKYRTVLFVHGCFWHRHPNCKDATTPKTNTAFWQEKFDKNTARDRRNQRALKKLGWHVLIVWTCQLEKNPAAVLQKVVSSLNTK